MKKVICSLSIGMSLVFAFPVFAATEYEIEVSHNDELFIIDGEKYEAKTYCFDMEEGDLVIFLKGSPNSVCVAAKLLNLRTKKACEVWCE